MGSWDWPTPPKMGVKVWYLFGTRKQQNLLGKFLSWLLVWMFIQANLGCVLRIHSLSFAYVERSSQNASQEVKFVWQGLNSLNTTNQWVLNDPKQDYGNLAGFKINFWGKNIKNHPQCWVLVRSHSKAQVHTGMRGEGSLLLWTLPTAQLGSRGCWATSKPSHLSTEPCAAVCQERKMGTTPEPSPGESSQQPPIVCNSINLQNRPDGKPKC